MSTAIVKRELDALSLMYAFEGKGVIEYFLPTCFMRVKKSTANEYATRKMIFSYVFIHDNERGIAALKKALPRLNLESPVSAKTGQRKYSTLPDYEMAMIRQVADAYAGQLPCYHRNTFNLDSCDRVRIVEGTLSGIEGAMAIKQGKHSGQVLLPLNDLFLVSTGEIPPNNYIVLQFGEGNRHPYHLFDNYLPRVTDALAQRLMTDSLETAAHVDLLKFVGKYGELSSRTLNIESTHAGLMLMSHAALGEKEEAEKWLERCHILLKSLKAELQIALHLAMMFAATGDRKIADSLRLTIDDWGIIAESDRKKKTVIDILEKFTRLYASLKYIK